MKSAKTISRMVVVASFLAVFCLFGFRSTFSVLQGPMSSDLGWSGSQLSAGYSLMMTIYAITAYFAGRVVDKSGTRPVYFAGAIFCCLGMVLTSFVSSLPLYFVCYGLFAGVGTGMLWVSSTTSVRKWFVGNQYATMWGIAFAGAPLAQVILSLLVKPLIVEDPQAWRFSMLIMGFIFLVLLLLAAFFAKKNPQDYGYEAFGELKKKPGAKAAHNFTLKEAFRTYPIYAAIFAFLFSMLGEFLIWSQIVRYWTTDLNMDLGTATSLYIVIGIAGIFTMPIMGKVADKIVARLGNEPKARKLVLIFAPAVGVIACALLLYMRSNVSLVLGGFICFLFAIYWAIEPGGVAGYAGSIYGGANFGKIWGLATLIVMGIGPAVGSFMGGYLADISGSYVNSIYFALGGFAISALFALSMPLSAKVKEEETEPEAVVS